jgi:eukaryotic-like serine/threonine-protein kinase
VDGDPTPPGPQPTLLDPARAATTRMPAHDRGPGTVAGRYALRERIGAGGMCEVWRADDLRLDRPVALKLLLPHLAHDADARARFEVEARRAARIASPRVVRVLDAGEAAGSEDAAAGVEGPEAWMAMELVDGPPLSQVLAAGPLAPASALRVAVEVAEGLAAAHELGVVHRDVKPGNVLLAADGARLSDFGIARAEGDARVTATGQMVGTAAYLAPEQARGELATPASDVYALGCVLFEALTGRPRFAGEGPMQVALARVGAATHVADLGPDVPPGAAQAAVDLLAEDPAARPPDGAAAAARLRRALAEVGVADVGAGVAAVPSDAHVREAVRSAPHLAHVRGQDGAPVALLLLAAVLLAPRGGDEPAAPSADVAEAAPATAAPLQVAGATSFDPQGGGGEHEDEVALLLDGDPATAWTTERYDTAAFGGLKPGVGVVLDLGEAVRVAEVRLLGLAPGQDLELRVADAAPADLAATRVVARADDAGADAVLAPQAPVEATHLVVWLIGELPPGGGGFRGQVGEVQVVPAA